MFTVSIPIYNADAFFHNSLFTYHRLIEFRDSGLGPIEAATQLLDDFIRKSYNTTYPYEYSIEEAFGSSDSGFIMRNEDGEPIFYVITFEFDTSGDAMLFKLTYC